MDIQNIIKKRERKTVLLTIRVTPEISKWLKDEDYSPTGIFHEAIKELGYDDTQNVQTILNTNK